MSNLTVQELLNRIAVIFDQHNSLTPNYPVDLECVEDPMLKFVKIDTEFFDSIRKVSISYFSLDTSITLIRAQSIIDRLAFMLIYDISSDPQSYDILDLFNVFSSEAHFNLYVTNVLLPSVLLLPVQDSDLIDTFDIVESRLTHNSYVLLNKTRFNESSLAQKYVTSIHLLQTFKFLTYDEEHLNPQTF